MYHHIQHILLGFCFFKPELEHQMLDIDYKDKKYEISKWHIPEK